MLDCLQVRTFAVVVEEACDAIRNHYQLLLLATFLLLALQRLLDHLQRVLGVSLFFCCDLVLLLNHRFISNGDSLDHPVFSFDLHFKLCLFKFSLALLCALDTLLHEHQLLELNPLFHTALPQSLVPAKPVNHDSSLGVMSFQHIKVLCNLVRVVALTVQCFVFKSLFSFFNAFSRVE